MPALSFQEEWLLKLLNETKQQTTRPQTDRIKVGDIVHIYNKQRSPIANKPERKLTALGFDVMHNRHSMSTVQLREGLFHAHFLGKVEIIEVCPMLPLKNSSRSAWAKADGFDNFTSADTWFTKKYGEEWVDRWWTVIRWNGWQERYFEPGE